MLIFIPFPYILQYHMSHTNVTNAGILNTATTLINRKFAFIFMGFKFQNLSENEILNKTIRNNPRSTITSNTHALFSAFEIINFPTDFIYFFQPLCHKHCTCTLKHLFYSAPNTALISIHFHAHFTAQYTHFTRLSRKKQTIFIF